MKNQNNKEKKQLIEKSEKITFLTWFAFALKAGKVKFWQELEFKTFFKEKGLTEIEDKERFEEIFKQY